MPIYLLLFFFAYFVLTMLLPRWRVKKQTGREALVVPKDDSAAGFIGKVFRLLFLLVLTVLLVNVFAPAWEKYLLPADFLKTKYTWWAGMVSLHVSLALIVITQYQMSRSWRVGFDETERTELVTSGMFRYSRNPIFLGMLLTMFGLFLALPNAVTLVVFVLACTVLQIQVRLEEAYLRSAQGEPYEQYSQKVGRWL